MTSVQITQMCPGGNTVTPVHRARLFCYTAFSESPPTLKCQYHAYGKETCPTTGKHHWQGFVYFANAKTLSATIKLLRPHHVEICKGSLEQNEAYCSKTGNYTEVGIKPRQGARNDLKDVIEQLKSGETTVEEILMEEPVFYHQYGRTLEKAEDLINRKRHRDFMTQGYWFWGPTNCGKSHKAHEMSSNFYSKPSDGRWWDGYAGQEAVIIDDFRGDIPFNELLRIVDRYPMAVPRRGREPHPFLSKLVIITSPLSPWGVYDDLKSGDSMEQLERRFIVEEMTARS